MILPDRELTYTLLSEITIFIGARAALERMKRFHTISMAIRELFDTLAFTDSLYGSLRRRARAAR